MRTLYLLTSCAALVFLHAAHAEMASYERSELGASEGLQQPQGPGVHDKIHFTPRTVGALVLACICALMANAAGIGGGPIYLPLLMVVIGFELTPATALSHTIVATSAVASSLYGMIATSPNDERRSLIDWDLTIFIPALLIGVSVGVLFNVLIPRWLQTVLLTILLLSVTFKTFNKGIKMWRSEQKDTALKARIEQEEVSSDDSGSETEGVLHEERYHPKPHRMTRSQSVQARLQRSSLAENGSSRQPLLERHEESPAQKKVHKATHAMRGCLGRQPVLKITGVVLLWILFLVFQELKTRHNRCSKAYLTLFVVELVLLILFTGLGIWSLAHQAQNDPEHRDPELRQVLGGQEGSSGGNKKPVWRLLQVAVVMAVAGAMAGLLGIGARALIFNPFLLALGVHPQVTASTSVLMILFSSSAISISLGFQGYLNASYAAVFAPLAFVSSILGVTLIGRLVKKTGHTSIIVFILTALIAVGTILTAVFGGKQSVDEYKAGEPMGLKPFCSQ